MKDHEIQKKVGIIFLHSPSCFTCSLIFRTRTSAKIQFGFIIPSKENCFICFCRFRQIERWFKWRFHQKKKWFPEYLTKKLIKRHSIQKKSFTFIALNQKLFILCGLVRIHTMLVGMVLTSKEKSDFNDKITKAPLNPAKETLRDFLTFAKKFCLDSLLFKQKPLHKIKSLLWIFIPHSFESKIHILDGLDFNREKNGWNEKKTISRVFNKKVNERRWNPETSLNNYLALPTMFRLVPLFLEQVHLLKLNLDSSLFNLPPKKKTILWMFSEKSIITPWNTETKSLKDIPPPTKVLRLALVFITIFLSCFEGLFCVIWIR